MPIEDIFQSMRELVAEHFEVNPEEITMDTEFEGDLGADSVDVVELVMSVEDTFEIGETPEDVVTTLKTVGDVVNYIAGKLED
ncbi:acyl carrier protein [uncultured Oscillibacter sp.]|uniref:acyl carrier protein n=1 Tax=uncultured Oscillibacter sp. TaxID=876091 RepID=UPI0025DC252A|nr:acyl carrier protein [uncultured Oscillibacter sp.]